MSWLANVDIHDEALLVALLVNHGQGDQLPDHGDTTRLSEGLVYTDQLPDHGDTTRLSECLSYTDQLPDHGDTTRLSACLAYNDGKTSGNIEILVSLSR